MTGLVRKAILLSAVGLIVAGAAFAGVPSPGNSTAPARIVVTGYSNPPDPLGNITYVIRDAANFPVANAEVVLDFTQCTDIRLSDVIFFPGNVTTCASKRVTGTTDGLGQLTVSVVGAANQFAGPTPPRAINDCVQVTVNSVPFPDMSAAALDQNGVTGVASGDFSAIVSDFVLNPSAGRSDVDGTGAVASGDLSLLIAIFVSGSSGLSSITFCN